MALGSWATKSVLAPSHREIYLYALPDLPFLTMGGHGWLIRHGLLQSQSQGEDHTKRIRFLQITSQMDEPLLL